MRKIVGLSVALFFMLGLVSQAAAPVPRPAPEFKMRMPSGQEMAISPIKGKVTVIQFLFTWCPHCQVTAQWLSNMQAELGPKGVQVFGVAFNDEVQVKDTAAANKLVIEFGQYAKFPVGLSSREAVLKYLGFSVMDRYGVPQLVVIDKKGNIQAQTKPSPAKGEVVEEPVMRALVNKLLAEK